MTGARHLACLDVPLPIIMLLGRWGSNVIMRYVADAPLSTLTTIYLQRLKDTSVTTLRAALGTQQQQLALTAAEQSTAAGSPHAAAAATTAADKADDPDDAEAGSKYVYSERNRTYHLAGTWAAFSRPRDWKSPCGYKYGTSVFSWVSTLPAPEDLCKQCRRYGLPAQD